MKQTVHLLFSLFLFSSQLTGQTTISGIINAYSPVISLDSCLASVRVEESGLFAAGDRVLLIQMQGATIQSSDNADFGKIIDLGSAGNYELATIQGIASGNIFLEKTFARSYEISGKVQLVKIPVYNDVQILDSLSGQPWDGSSGGIIALIVEGELTFGPGALIDASEIGFRGGETLTNLPNDCSWISPQNDFYYDLNSWRGAAKGEGIAAYINNREAGKGPQANGGGGGNDHNAGGGGGSHFAAGGNGGRNEEPSTFGCQGNHPGWGGRVLPVDNSRIYLGGGGGAGHSNNNVGTDGGNGGGIILIQAKTISIAGNESVFIKTNGGSPDFSLGDGAGGGGAGGSLRIEAETLNLQGDLFAEAKGGNGGSVNNGNQNRCFGPGGGGSGGSIDINGFLPSHPGWNPAVDGGEAGQSTNSTACSISSNGAQPGEAGIQDVFTNWIEGTIPNLALSIPGQPTAQEGCIGDSVVFSVNVTGIEVTYQWQMDQGSGFMNLVDGAPFNGTQTPELQINSLSLNLDGAAFRCVVGNDCYGELTSMSAMLTVIDDPQANFSFSLNGNLVNFINLSTNATTFLWDFGDSQSSTLANPNHTYVQDGTYNVTLTATNSCGSHTYTVEIEINTQAAPVAAFFQDQMSGCSPLSVQFTDQSSNDPTGWNWSFPGGNPASSSLQNPQVLYTLAGIYDVFLTVTNAIGSDQTMANAAVLVEEAPLADFTFMQSGSVISFSNGSLGGNTYLWDFGDGQSSTVFSPNHTYAMDGTYTVILTVSNNCGSDIYEQQIVISSLQPPVADFTFNSNQGCTPLEVQFADLSSGEVTAWNWTFPGGNPNQSSEANPLVRYEQAGIFDVQLVVSNDAGSDEYFLAEAIRVEILPTAAFSFSQNGYTFSFDNNSEDAAAYSWDFGDGSAISNEINPVHTYADDGVYQVTLTASGSFCSAITSSSISIFLDHTNNTNADFSQTLFPNPARKIVYMKKESQGKDFKLKIYDASGKVMPAIIEKKSDLWEVTLENFAPGVYYFQITTKENTVVKKLVVF